MKKIDVIICGLVRNKEKLLAKVEQFENWKNQNIIEQIIFSTWIGEIDKYNGLRKVLSSKNVILLEIEEPKLVLKGGHQLHQMTSFFYGLSYIENKDKYVLKTRVDLADNHDLMLHYFQNGTERTEDFLKVDLGNKIIIENAQMLYPFLCGDAQFFGKKKDLEKLINFSNEMEIVFNRLAVEQTFFFEPFKNIKVFREHFYWNLPHISEISVKREEQISFIMNETILIDLIKLWWMVLNSYFIIGWNNNTDHQIEFNNVLEAFEYDGEYKLIGGDKSDVITSSIFVEALTKSFLPEEIVHLKNMALNQSYSNPFNIEVSKFDAYEKFRKKFSDLPSAKATKSVSEKYLIHGAAQHFFVKDTHDKASSRYHEQVTALRRENDLLKKELNIHIAHSKTHKILNRLLPRKIILFIKYRLPYVTNFYAKYIMNKKVK